MSNLESATKPFFIDGYKKSDERKYSLGRLLKNAFDDKKVNASKKSWSLEAEVSEDLEKKHHTSLGADDYLVPLEALGIRSLSTLNTGSSLIGNSHSDFFNFYPEPTSYVVKMGAKVVTGLRDRYEICGSDRPFEAYFVEELDTIPKNNPNFSKITMQPHKLGVRCDLSVEMLNQTPAFAEATLAQGLQNALARAIDETVLTGSGTDRPLGLLNHPDVNSVIFGTNGDVPDWAAVVEMEKKVLDNDPPVISSLAYFVNSPTAGALKRTEKVSGTGEFVMSDQLLYPLDEVKVLNSRPAIITNNLPKNLVKGTGTDLSAMLFGDWSQIVIGFFGPVSLAIDPFSRGNFDTGMVTIRAFCLIDVAILNPQLFCVATDVKTTNS